MTRIAPALISCSVPCSVNCLIRLSSPLLLAGQKSLIFKDAVLVSVRYGFLDVFSADVYTLTLFLQMFTVVASALCFTRTAFYCKLQPLGVSSAIFIMV